MAFDYIFPDPEMADDDGLIAAGGDLSVEALLSAYSNGIFPWFSKGDPILWWSPNPRMVLKPGRLKLSASLKQKLKNPKFEVKIDNNFTEVIKACASVSRKGQDGTWITDDMIEAYVRMHDKGYAHSFETYYNGKLVGGLYGISLGRAFFGESMFHIMSDASKISLFCLHKFCLKFNFYFIDVQQSTTHLKSLGAEDVTRSHFLKMLKMSLNEPSLICNWGELVINW